MRKPLSHIRRALVQGLDQAGLKGKTAVHFAEQLIGMIGNTAPLPEAFFDISRTIRILANIESLEHEAAKEDLIRHPEKMLEIFDLPVRQKNKYPKLKYHPTKTERIEAAIAVRNKYGTLPNSRNCGNGDHEFLPKDSIGWTYLLRIYYHDKGIKLSDEVADYERGKVGAPGLAMPSDYRIYKRAMIYMAKNNALPPPSKIRFQGIKSPYWEDIHNYLQKRGLTLGALIVMQQNKKNGGTAHLRTPSIMPPNDDIARWAIGRRHRLGILPPLKETITTVDGKKITADKVRERLIHERGITLTKLVDEFEKANPLMMSKISARDVFVEAARITLETGVLPDKRKNNVALGDITARGADRHFHHRTVEDLDPFLLKHHNTRSLREFFVHSGLAEKKGGEIIPAPREKIEQLIAAYGS